MPTDKDIEDALRKMGKEKVEYPKELRNGTRDEYKFHVSQAKKGKSCPLAVLTYMVLPALVAGKIILEAWRLM